MYNSVASSRTANNITLLRHVAAFFVLITHAYGLTGNLSDEFLYKISGHAIQFSTVGLIIFFFISGFLITQSLVSSSGIKQFIWKRFLRIYPALIVLIILTVFILGPLVTKLPVKEYFSDNETWGYLSGASLVRLRFYLPGVFNSQGVNGSLWTLPVEFRLYLLLALLFLIGLIKKRNWYFLFVLFFVICALIMSSFFQDSFYLNYFSPYLQWGMYFLTGSVVFFLKDKIIPDYKLVIVLLIIWYLTKDVLIVNRISELICFSYLTLWLSFKTPVVYPDFFKKNDFSYSMYLYAFPIQQIFISKNYQISPLMLILFTSLALIPICLLSWNLVEKPALTLKSLKI